MFSYIKKALTVPSNDQEEIRKLIRYEAKIGGKLFGPIAKNHHREFFCLDEHTWVWHEEWIDSNNHKQIMTTRYDVRANGIYKTQNNQPYSRLSNEELINFHEAVNLYGHRIGNELNKLINQT